MYTLLGASGDRRAFLNAPRRASRLGGVLMQHCLDLARAWGVRVWYMRGCAVPEL